MFEDLPLNVKRSRRKTLSIYIERDGSVSVLAPDNATDDDIEQVLKDKEYRIYKHLAEWEMMNSARIDREVVNGQSYLYLGRNYRLELVNEQEKPLILKNGYFLLRKKDKAEAQKHFIEFYKEKGYVKIQQKIDKYKGWMAVNPNKIRIMELKNRWASCSEKKNLNFHWKCIMAPMDVITYLVVHEMAHLLYPNHTKAFWNEIDKMVPNYQEQVNWLKQHGAGLDI